MRASAVLRSVIYRTLAVALAVLAVLSTIMPAPAYAADTDQQVKTVRVGWLVSNEGFQNGTPASVSRMGLRVPPDSVVLHARLAVRIRLRHLH